jgi:hypothetical protein
MPPTIERKLRIQFQKSIRHGFVKNACLDPIASSLAAQAAETGEEFIIRVDSKKGGHYWFSDRRVLREESDAIREYCATKLHNEFIGCLKTSGKIHACCPTLAR